MEGLNPMILVALVICAVIFIGACSNREFFRRRGRRGRGGGYRSLWSPWSYGGGYGGGYRWPYSRYGSGWPPYLYGGHSYGNYNQGPKCITTNEASDCTPNHPVKVGTDSNDNGIKDSWSCCRKY